MIILAAADTIAGDADAASFLTCTIFGMELNAGTETYMVLYQGQIGNASGTLYTVPSNTQAFIRSIVIVNTDTVPHTFELFRGGTAAANQITPVMTLQAGTMAVYEDGLGWQFFNSSGMLLVGQATGTPVIDNYGISTSKGETMDRNICPEVNTTIGTTGQIYCQAIWLAAGVMVTNISFHSATTAAGTPTHYVFALYDSARNLLASSADQTSTAWGANTLRTLAMGTPYLVPTTGLYYLMLSVVATTVPTMKGGTARTGGQLAGQALIISGLSSTTYASGTAPASLGAITVGTTSIWGCVT